MFGIVYVSFSFDNFKMTFCKFGCSRGCQSHFLFRMPYKKKCIHQICFLWHVFDTKVCEPLVGRWDEKWACLWQGYASAWRSLTQTKSFLHIFLCDFVVFSVNKILDGFVKKLQIWLLRHCDIISTINTLIIRIRRKINNEKKTKEQIFISLQKKYLNYQNCQSWKIGEVKIKNRTSLHNLYESPLTPSKVIYGLSHNQYYHAIRIVKVIWQYRDCQ